MKIKFKNIAGAIESFMQNSATAVRTWVFPDKNGTVAMLDDVAAAQSNAQGYADSKVENAINSGTTTKAPSEDAVFNALAAKSSTTYVDSSIATEVINRNAAIAAALVGLVDYRGGFDASVNAYPSSGGSGSSGAILKSDFWIVTVAGTLPTGIIVTPGDWIFAKVDAPGNTQANWDVVETNFGYVPVSVSGAEIYATASGTNTYTATLSPTPAYAAGFTVRLKFTNANTGASTINLNSLGAKGIKKNVSTDLASGDIPAGAIVELIYDGTNFQAIGILVSGGGAVASVFGRSGAVVAASGDYTAAQVSNTPAGGIAGATVQTALNELDTEKVNKTGWVPLSDGATTTWDTLSEQNPMGKWTMGGTARTLAMTNLKSDGATGILVVKTGVAGAITLTFPSGSVTDNGTLTTYTFPAGINVFYDLTWYFDGSATIKWLIGVSNIDTDATMAANSDLLVASQKATKTADATVLASAQSYADGLVTGLWDDRGSHSAAGGAYPSSGGSGAAGAIKKGDIWTISVAGTLPTSQVVEIGDTVRALIDTPGNTQANWAIAQNNIGYVPENVANKNASGGYVGLTLFKIMMRNVANTFTSFLTNVNTAARTYTFPDRDGNVADEAYADAGDQAIQRYAEQIVSYVPMKQAMDVATTTTLPAYTAFPGTITTLQANANGYFPTTDGVLNDASNTIASVLVKDEVGGNAKYNGTYTLQKGSPSTKWILTRTLDSQYPGAPTDGKSLHFAEVTIERGSVNAGKKFRQETVPIVIDTTNQTWFDRTPGSGTTSQFALVQSMRNFYGY